MPDTGRAPDIRVLILSGGFGSRSENPALPKILQKIGPDLDLARMHLSTVSDAGFVKVTFLLGSGASDVITRLQELMPLFPKLEVGWLIDEEISGTSNSVISAVSNLNDDEYLLILGDTAIQGSLSCFVQRAKRTNGDIVIASHPNLHPLDSDRVIVDEFAKVLAFAKKKSPPMNARGVYRALTGILFFKKSLLKDNFSQQQESDVTSLFLGMGIANGVAFSINCSFYLKDSGTPQRIATIREDFYSGSAQRRGLQNRPAIFLDRDGTLIPDLGTSRIAIVPTDVQVETCFAISQVNRAGIPIFLVTNQPGIAKGQITFDDFYEVQTQLENVLAEANAFLDDFAFCPHYPESGFNGEVKSLKINCECRKPKPGMIQKLATEHHIDLKRSTLIGDTQNDFGAAEAAGMTFTMASRDNEKRVAEAIIEAMERILNDHY